MEVPKGLHTERFTFKTNYTLDPKENIAKNLWISDLECDAFYC